MGRRFKWSYSQFVVDLLKSKADMLKDYFSLEITQVSYLMHASALLTILCCRRGMSEACPSSCPHTHLTWTAFLTSCFTWLQRYGGGGVGVLVWCGIPIVGGRCVRVPIVGGRCASIHSSTRLGVLKALTNYMCIRGPARCSHGDHHAAVMVTITLQSW